MRLFKTVRLAPREVITLDGVIVDGVDRDRVLAELKQDAIDLTTLACFIARNDTTLEREYRALEKPPSSLSALGRALHVNLPDYATIPRATGESRRAELLRYNVMNYIKNWVARVDAVQGNTDKYVSSGWKRTMNTSKPSLENIKPYLNLGAVDKQYCEILNNPLVDHEIHLKLVINRQWWIIRFEFDAHRFHDAIKVCNPTISVASNGELRFDYPVEYSPQYALVSKYVIGVDVGLNSYVTASIIDSESGVVVGSTTLSQRVHSLWNSVQATSLQVKYLQVKNRKSEASLHRSANRRKKRELAILVGQELANIAFEYGNASIVFEDLGWVENTMANGRWNRGAVVKWTEHYHRLNGGLTFKVNPVNTSKDCSNCGAKLCFKTWKLAYCKTCDVSLDRDVNASVNIAKRCIPSIVKARKTRAKRADAIPRAKNTTPRTHPTLTYKGVKPPPPRPSTSNTATVVLDTCTTQYKQDSKKATRYLGTTNTT